MRIHLLSRQDSKEYFGSSSLGKDLIINNGYLPIHINIENNTNNYLHLRPSYIDLTIQPSNRIAKLLHVDTSHAMYCLCVPALLFWWQAIPFIIIPMGLNMRRSNQKIGENLQFNALQTWKEVSIAPYEIIDKFVFIRARDFKQRFGIRLFNEDERKLISFDVNLICGTEFMESSPV